MLNTNRTTKINIKFFMRSAVAERDPVPPLAKGSRNILYGKRFPHSERLDLVKSGKGDATPAASFDSVFLFHLSDTTLPSEGSMSAAQ